MIRITAFLLVLSMAMAFLPQASASESIPNGEKIVYGLSGEGRELCAYRYGNGENVLIMGFAIHGFEDNFDRDGECLVYTGELIMEHLSTSLLPQAHNWSVYILPCMNPDGLYSGWTNYGPEDNSTILYGTKGVMRIYDDPAHSIVVNLNDGTTQHYDVDAIQTNDNQTKSGIIDLWMDALVQNKEPEISGESALAAMRAVFASIRSSETGMAVEIPENR